ncbi:hypothetical protein PCE1_004593 [Barthelona sp. PCE]
MTIKQKIHERLPFIAEKLGMSVEEILEKLPHLKMDADPIALPNMSEDVDPLTLSVYIDHTVLKPMIQKQGIVDLINDAKKHNFKAVCVNGCWAEFCKDELEGTGIMVASVIGFPLGAMTPSAKVGEITELVGRVEVDEIDMVLNIGQLLDGNLRYVYDEIEVCHAATEDKCLKVIFECGAISKECIIDASIICALIGVGFVKTSTGFGYGGALPEDVELMKQCVAERCEVKASGGVRSPVDAVKMINLGATRIGTSSGKKIIAVDVAPATGY